MLYALTDEADALSGCTVENETDAGLSRGRASFSIVRGETFVRRAKAYTDALCRNIHFPF
jgi:hypothetical protein